MMSTSMLRLVGVLALAAGTGILAVFIGTRATIRSAREDVNAIFANAKREDNSLVTAEMLTRLPPPVQRHLLYAGAVDRPVPRTVRLKYAGRIRQGPDRPWMTLAAEEYYSTAQAAFVWIATIRTAGVPIVTVIDRYQAGRGNIRVTLGGLRVVDDQRGPEIDQGAMMRYLNEMMWFPAAFLGATISWKAIDDHSAEVTLTDHGRRATAVVHFDGAGRLTNFVAQRYRSAGSTYSFDTWSTPMTEYRELAGLRLPARGTGVWNLDDGPFEYIDVAVTDVEYDVSKAY
jgi:hypothetical protein